MIQSMQKNDEQFENITPVESARIEPMLEIEKEIPMKLDLKNISSKTKSIHHQPKE